MRAIICGLFVLALAACGERQEVAQSGCDRRAAQEVAFSETRSNDIVVASANGPTCAQTIVTLSVRNAEGDPLWAFASTYQDMVHGGEPAEATPAPTTEDVDRFLAGWADLTTKRSGELPEWRADAASLTESVEGFSYDTPFDRETFEMLRARNVPMVCYAASIEGSQCLIIDPSSHAPIMIVAFGP